MITEPEFRAQVRSVLDATLPRKGAAGAGSPHGAGASPVGDRAVHARDYQRRLFEAGLAGLTWPTEYGGQGLPARYQRIFDEEVRAYQVPPLVLDIGLGMCGPTILVHGTEEQKRSLLPPLLRGEHMWCELFSEPGSGSDLASVQTRAVRDGDTWIVSGQKVWTSGAQQSDRAACLVRTDPDRPKREGITMLLVDMHAPGITVRPLRQITGDAHFNEVFLDDVPVPVDAALGEINGGWKVARTMLAFERQTLGAMGSGGGGRGGVAAIIDVARTRGLLDQPAVRQQLADLRIRQLVLRYLASARGDASVLKLAMAQLVQHTAEVAINVVGPTGVAWDGDRDRWASQLLNSRSASIGGGTNEVVRNVIAERVLGLPRDVEVDLDVPFRELKVGTQRGS